MNNFQSRPKVSVSTEPDAVTKGRGFIFGGNTGVTYDQLQQRRKVAESMMQRTSTPRNVGEGLDKASSQIVGALMQRQVNQGQEKLQGEFNQKYEAMVPEGMRQQADLFSNPMASPGQQKVIAALMKGTPGFRHGTKFAPGGDAIVGEDGPEVVKLPRGAQVIPNPNTQMAYDEGGPASDPLAHRQWLQQQIDQASPEEMEKIRAINERYQHDGANGPEQMPAQQFEQYDPASQQRMQGDPDAMRPAPMDMRELLPQEESRFDDAAAYQTADLDAFKMMQLQPNYGDAVSHDANATESRRLQLLRRAMFADAALDDPRLARSMTKMDNNIAGSMGALGRMYTGDDYELGRLMAEQFSSAVLRGDSGAQTPEPEVRRYIKQYFPLTGETPEQITAKKAMRREEIRAMIQSLPEDARPAAMQIQSEIEDLKRQADVPDGSLTGGAEMSDDDKAYLKSLGIE